ncbi:MAG: hypothetical protein IT337_16175 [Thermomicrobiales bacterium]|nr:hypothetical protein [Thermomicrobiales bacterium]
MAFEDDFAACLTNVMPGFDFQASDIPAEDEVRIGAENLAAWLNALEPDTLAAVDEVTADFGVSQGLADPSVGIAVPLLPILLVVDNTPVSMPISSVVQSLSMCLP